MNVNSLERVCIYPYFSGVGGGVSFREKMTAGLNNRGIDVSFDLKDQPYEAVLVIGGTRNVTGLLHAKRRGVRILQRLDGMNWLHRVRKSGKRTSGGLVFYLKSELTNMLLSLIRAYLADHVVYQSEFSRTWWQSVRGPTPVPSSVVHNGVDLRVFSPSGEHSRPDDVYRLLLVEGNLMGGYETGLETAKDLALGLAQTGQLKIEKPVELMIVGNVPREIRSSIETQLASATNRDAVSFTWSGLVPQEEIAQIDRSAHLLYSADVNAACPNSVIEAMACGLPVLAFDTGALSELVMENAGCVVPYGSNPWKLEKPDINALVDASVKILHDQDKYRSAARLNAQAHFSLNQMVDGYLRALLK